MWTFSLSSVEMLSGFSASESDPVSSESRGRRLITAVAVFRVWAFLLLIVTNPKLTPVKMVIHLCEKAVQEYQTKGVHWCKARGIKFNEACTEKCCHALALFVARGVSRTKCTRRYGAISALNIQIPPNIQTPPEDRGITDGNETSSHRSQTAKHPDAYSSSSRHTLALSSSTIRILIPIPSLTKKFKNLVKGRSSPPPTENYPTLSNPTPNTSLTTHAEADPLEGSNQEIWIQSRKRQQDVQMPSRRM